MYLCCILHKITCSGIPHTIVYVMICRFYPQIKLQFLVEKSWSGKGLELLSLDGVFDLGHIGVILKLHSWAINSSQ
jgi:hypothetical protein